jgi:hypothetical protein
MERDQVEAIEVHIPEIELRANLMVEQGQLDSQLAQQSADLVGELLAVAQLDEPLQELTAALNKHLKHEEDSALPLIQSVLTPSDWRGFAAAMRHRQGYKGATISVPWLLDGFASDERERVLTRFPAPVRLLNKLRWEPQCRQQNLWALR